MSYVRSMRALSLAALCLVAAAQAWAQERPSPRSRVLPPVVVAAESRLPVEVSRVDVRAEIAGREARSRIELELYNPNARVLEGELQFPLAPGQTVIGFALDIDGELRPAVPVEKAKGRRVFEDISRAQVDPALLEVIGGNNYKLRVYPLPAQGRRRVVLDLVESLQDPAYHLPLAFDGKVARLDARVRVAGVAPAQLRARFGASSLSPRGVGWADAEVELSRRDHEQDGVLVVELPSAQRHAAIAVGDYRGERYFYADLPAPALVEGKRAAPKTLAILWDASGSAEMRDLDRELALLDAYFRSLGDIRLTVALLVARDVAEPVREFSVDRGDWRRLRQHLQALALDGATNLGALQVPPGADMALLFSDGLGTYQSDELPPSSVPLYTVNSALRGNTTLLRAAAEASGAMHLDLAHTDSVSAVRALHTVPARLTGLRGVGAGQLVAASPYPRDGYVQLAGLLTAPQAELTLEWLDGEGRVSEQIVPLAVEPSAISEQELPLAAWRWASLRLQALQRAPRANRAAIRRLATHFKLASAETSLIVLDTVEDYVRHEIEPPASLLPKYRQLLAQAGRTRELRQAEHLERVARRFAERAAWWDRSFPKDQPAAAPPDKDEARRAALAAEERHARERRRAEAGRVMRAMENAPVPAPAAAQAEQAAAETGAVIRLRRWEPDAPYIARFKQSDAAALYAAYLDEKPSYAQSTAFFLDAADRLLERGQRELALRVLSNLAEMELEDRHILRILGYRLLQAGRVDLALPVLERVRELAPDEPQSWRDLGLALAAAGKPQQGLEQLWEVVRRPWDDRFADIALIALTELNTVVARMQAAGQTPDLSGIDPRLLRHMPLDLRVVLAWDADNTDIDLWVIDPNGEAAYYANPLTYQGGAMSRDFTGGYGPEVFELRHAKPGTYTVKARFYGHRQQVVAPATTLMLRFSTGYGSAAQRDEMVTLRLAQAKDEVVVGTFEVK